MYKVGAKVVHQREGACYIRKLAQMEMSDVKKEYYVLEPVIDKKAIVYIATDSNHQERMRPVITREQMKNSEAAAEAAVPVWIDNMKARNHAYEKTISEFEFLDVFLVMKYLAVQNRKKLLGAKDKQLFLNAQKLVCSEISAVLNEEYDLVAEKVNTFLCG